MARPRKKADDRLMSLSEVSRRTGISMPTLLRYKKLFASRIPSQGSGRTQRYPEAALAVIAQLKKENLAKRGRRRGAKTAAPDSERGLLSLSEVGRRTGISYPTLLRYVALHLGRLPHVGSGRTRRFRPEAVEAFATLRRESRRGRRPGAQGQSRRSAARRPGGGMEAGGAAGAWRRLDRIERGQAALVRELRRLATALSRPLRFTVSR